VTGTGGPTPLAYAACHNASLVALLLGNEGTSDEWDFDRSLHLYHVCLINPEPWRAASNERRPDKYPVLFCDLPAAVDHNSCSEHAFLMATPITWDATTTGSGRNGVSGICKCPPFGGVNSLCFRKVSYFFLTLRPLFSEHIYDTEPLLTRHQN
jgi:hypothetical protein